MNFSTKQGMTILTLLGAIIIGAGGIFTLDQRMAAIVFQFGEAMRVVEEPGLHIKIPFIQNVEYFDKRLLTITADAKELTASDGKRVIIDAFAKYKITDPVTFYKTVYSTQNMELRLSKILESSMREVIGRIKLMNLLSGDRGNIMGEISKIVNADAKAFGVDVIDVRILRADLPKENSEGVYKRMQTERAKEAKQIRAEGEEESARVRSKADRESKVILAEAYKNAQIIKGEGDLAASKIYNDAYSKDPEFYQFYRTLDSYKQSLNNGKTTFVVSPKSGFLKYLQLD